MLKDHSVIMKSNRATSLIDKLVNEYSLKALQFAIMFSKHEAVKKAYNMDDPAMGKQFLYDKISQLITSIENESKIKNFKVHFHKPHPDHTPNNPVIYSFLKEWLPKDKYHNISPWRSTVNYVAKTNKSLRAVEAGRAGYVIRGIAPILVDGKYIGSVEVFFDIFNIIPFLTEKSSKDGIVLLVNKQEAEKVFNKNQLEKYTKDRIQDVIVSRISKKWIKPKELLSIEDIRHTKNIKQPFTRIKNDISITYIPMKDFSNVIIGYFVYINDFTNEKKAFDQTLVITNILLIAVGVIIILVILYFTRRFVIKPVDQLAHYFEDMGSGHGDLTVKLDDSGKDEFGIMSRYFNGFLQFLNQMILQIIHTIDKTKEIGKDLSSIIDQAKSTISFTKTNVDMVNDKVTQLDQAIESATKSTNDINLFITNVIELIESQSSSINESSASIEEMTASIQNIAMVSEEKLQIANELEKTALGGEHEMNKTKQMINEVANSAHLIMEMINVINNIAEQTNLLAMNAAIEAAHAGSAGKGFAVVADEIRKLAENTSKNSSEISRSLKEVIEYIHSSEDSTNKTGEIFNNILTRTKDVAMSMVEMRESTRELADGSAQVIKALQFLINISTNVKESSSEMGSKIKTISQSMESVNSISKDSKKRIEKIMESIHQVSSIFDVVRTSSSKNENNISELNNIIVQFKVESNHHPIKPVEQ